MVTLSTNCVLSERFIQTKDRQDRGGRKDVWVFDNDPSIDDARTWKTYKNVVCGVDNEAIIFE